MTDSNNAALENEDSREELSQEDGGTGEQVTDAHEDQQEEQQEDLETLKKRLKDTQAALTRAQQAAKTKEEPQAAKAKVGKVELNEEVIDKIYQNNLSDERFFQQHPELESQKQLLRDLRSTKFGALTPLSEVAIRYGLAGKSAEESKGRVERGSVAKRDDDRIPDFKTDPQGYEKWRKANVDTSRNKLRVI